MKINADLDLGETETLFSILNDQIVHHEVLKKLEFLAKEIDKSTYQWHKGHAKYLKGIFKKLSGKEWKV